jgi:hypothetical protein
MPTAAVEGIWAAPLFGKSAILMTNVNDITNQAERSCDDSRFRRY